MRTKARRSFLKRRPWMSFSLQDTAGAAEHQWRIKLLDVASYCGLERNNGSHLRTVVGQTELRLPGAISSAGRPLFERSLLRCMWSPRDRRRR